MAGKSRGPGRPPGTSKTLAERRDQLLAAAEDVIRSQGPDVSMGGIAKQAGVSKATLYDNFDGKADLTQALIVRNGQMLLAAYGEVLAEALIPEDFVRSGIEVFVRHVDAGPEIYRFIIANASGDALIDEIGLPLAALTRSVLAQQGKGPETAEALARTALGTLFAATAWWSQHRSLPRPVFERTLADFIWGGLVSAGIEPTTDPVDVAELAKVLASNAPEPKPRHRGEAADDGRRS